MLKKYDMNLFYSSIARLSIVCPAAKAVQFSSGFLVKKQVALYLSFTDTLYSQISVIMKGKGNDADPFFVQNALISPAHFFAAASFII